MNLPWHEAASARTCGSIRAPRTTVDHRANERSHIIIDALAPRSASTSTSPVPSLSPHTPYEAAG